MTLIIGSGMYDSEEEDFDYVEPGYQQYMNDESATGMDEFEEVTEP